MSEAAAETQSEQLDLDDREEQLPWLEGDDEYEQSGVDTARIAAFAIIGLLVIGLVVGGIWLATRPKTDPALLADGSTIPAPAGPYKEKPQDPGGKQFAGTGDTSFAVGEGKTREGQIAEDEEPAPSIDTQAASPISTPVLTKGVGVQVGAYQSKDAAESGWTKLVGQYDALSGLSHRVIEGQADIGKVFRLQAISGDRASANALCAKLKAAGGSCQVK